MSFADSTDAACTKCKFFDNHAAKAGGDEGLCRYNPPVTQPSAEAHGLWPVVSSSDWCGHFSKDAVTTGMAD
ncbi:hypothetical protein [Teichococcus vastitatis]|jgi:hypothetical protein|uniref:Uncharacterized protein n=1 Tax=Teichococcus vastitatis TaxID=2307076 RepID=A0ABS9W5N5_9PROT|nr:hypothetical protein [Pseudoroseomonas vastitatis]MCI0754608.1 hypothetical protein [Pseudoroseomonas vastitatis]